MEKEKDLVWNDHLSRLRCMLEAWESWVSCCKVARLLETYIHSRLRVAVAESHKANKQIMRPN